MHLFSPEVKRLRYLPVTEYGAGSTPVRTAVNGLLVQLARMPALHAGGREFESHTVHFFIASVV